MQEPKSKTYFKISDHAFKRASKRLGEMFAKLGAPMNRTAELDALCQAFGSENWSVFQSRTPQERPAPLPQLAGPQGEPEPAHGPVCHVQDAFGFISRCHSLGCDEIEINSDDGYCGRCKGKIALTMSPGPGTEALRLIANALRGADDSQARYAFGGNSLDFSYRHLLPSGGHCLYRANVTAVCSSKESGPGLNLLLLAAKAAPADIKKLAAVFEQSLRPGIHLFCSPDDQLACELRAGAIQALYDSDPMLRGASLNSKFDFDVEIPQGAGNFLKTQIGTHMNTCADGIRSAMRRNCGLIATEELSASTFRECAQAAGCGAYVFSQTPSCGLFQLLAPFFSDPACRPYWPDFALSLRSVTFAHAIGGRGTETRPFLTTALIGNDDARAILEACKLGDLQLACRAITQKFASDPLARLEKLEGAGKVPEYSAFRVRSLLGI